MVDYQSYNIHLIEIILISSQKIDMQRVRKRSFTNYENPQPADYENLGPIHQDSQISESISSFYQEELQTSRKVGMGLIKSKKAKFLNKFEITSRNTARTSTENQRISTIQSLKKQALIIQSDQILSYRLHSIKQENNQNSQKIQQTKQKQDNLKSVEELIKQFRSLKKQTVADKLRKRITQLNIKKRDFQSQWQVIGLKTNYDEKMKSIRSKYLSEKNKSSLSLTAVRFYRPKTIESKKTLQSSLGLSFQQGSVKKISIHKKSCSKSLLSI